jgi:hypothetical protein
VTFNVIYFHLVSEWWSGHIIMYVFIFVSYLSGTQFWGWIFLVHSTVILSSYSSTQARLSRSFKRGNNFTWCILLGYYCQHNAYYIVYCLIWCMHFNVNIKGLLGGALALVLRWLRLKFGKTASKSIFELKNGFETYFKKGSLF